MKKKLLALVMTLALAFTLVACNSVTPEKAGELVQAELDSQVKGQHDKLASIINGDVAEIKAKYDENIQKMVTEIRTALGMDISDELAEKVKNSILTIDSYAEYSIEESVKTDDGFMVTVNYKPLENFNQLEDIVVEKMQDMDYEALLTMTEDEQINVVLGIVEEVFDEIAAEPIYGDETTATVRVTLEDKLYTCNVSDFEDLVSKMLGGI